MPFKTLMQTVTQPAFIQSLGLSVITATASAATAQPTALDVRVELARHQFTPQVITACGITPGQAGTVIGYVIDQVEEHWDAVSEARQSLEALKSQHATLGIIVRSGQASSEEVTAFNQLEAQLQTAQSAYDSAFHGLDVSMLAALSTEQLNLFQTIRQNSDRRVAMKYHALELSDEEWLAFSGALATIKSYEDIEYPGDNPPPAAATQLVQLRDSTSIVNLMDTRLSTYLDGVQAAFENALLSLP